MPPASPTSDRAFERCLDALTDLSMVGEAAALHGLDGVIDRYLDTVDPEPSARADALYRMIAAFIVRDRSTRLRQPIIEQLTRRHRAFLSGQPVIARAPHSDPAKALLRRLEGARGRGLHVSPSEAELLISALQDYVSKGA